MTEPLGASSTEATNQATKSDPLVEEQATKFVNSLFERFDSNQDRQLFRAEMPRAMRRFGFSFYDYNGDGKLAESELMSYARRRFRSRDARR